MTYERKIEGFRELEASEVALVAGGQTDAEIAITDMYNNSDITSQDGNSAYSSEGVYFYDSDSNGWWDYAETSIGGETYIYDSETNTWRPKEGEPFEEPDNVEG